MRSADKSGDAGMVKKSPSWGRVLVQGTLGVQAVGGEADMCLITGKRGASE